MVLVQSYIFSWLRVLNLIYKFLNFRPWCPPNQGSDLFSLLFEWDNNNKSDKVNKFSANLSVKMQEIYRFCSMSCSLHDYKLDIYNTGVCDNVIKVYRLKRNILRYRKIHRWRKYLPLHWSLMRESIVIIKKYKMNTACRACECRYNMRRRNLTKFEVLANDFRCLKKNNFAMF